MSDTETHQKLANAFYAAAEDMKSKALGGAVDVATGETKPLPPETVFSSLIASDVLKAIGDVYQGQAIN